MVSVLLLVVVHVEGIFTGGRKNGCDGFGEYFNCSVLINDLSELSWYADYSFQGGILKYSEEVITHIIHGRISSLRSQELLL